MRFERRLIEVERLQKTGQIYISNGKYRRRDIAILRGGLIYIESKFPIIHPFEGYKLDNPMTLDTFTHIYLLGKPD